MSQQISNANRNMDNAFLKEFKSCGLF